MSAIQRNPKDSLLSTWRNDRSKWGISHYLLHIFYLYPNDEGKPVPVHPKTDKIQYMTLWSTNLWVLLHAAWPMALHHLYVLYTGHNLGYLSAFFLYMIAYQLNAVHQIQILRRLGHQLGFFDGDKHERDQVPDVGVDKVVASLLGITSIRPLYTVLLTYRTAHTPSLSLWLPVELFLYTIILDGWFYLYHRSCHEWDSLWQYHRTHHLTKHPNTMMSSYADGEQEFLEMIAIPLLTYGCLKLMGFPMGFYDCWMCLEFLIFAEAFGHSGVRVHVIPPGTSAPILRLFDCELATEDHDLHHRKGWKSSHNYGKQTRLWDRLFGTSYDRIESAESNVDYVNTINLPLI